MHERIQVFISNCTRSKLGRLVFVGYLIYVVSMISYACDHIGMTSYPYRFYGERELFQLLNSPQIELIRAARAVFRSQPDKFTDSIAAVFVALPWWGYGYIFESIVRRIANTVRPG